MTIDVLNTLTIDITACHACGVQFGMPKSLLAARRADGKGFWCPNGHSLAFRETEAPRQQLLFELQLAAYRKARDLVHACDIAVATGMPVHEDMVAAWVAARSRWRMMRHELRLSQRGPS